MTAGRLRRSMLRAGLASVLLLASLGCAPSMGVPRADIPRCPDALLGGAAAMDMESIEATVRLCVVLDVLRGD